MSLQFLREMVAELENALFSSESGSLVNLPTHIVRESAVDEDGNIWFVIPRPTQVIESFAGEMAANLDYFKKAKDYFVKISGTATLITDAQELERAGIASAFREALGDTSVAVRIKVNRSVYSEKAPKPVSNPFLMVGAQVYNWLLNPLLTA